MGEQSTELLIDHLRKGKSHPNIHALCIFVESAVLVLVRICATFV